MSLKLDNSDTAPKSYWSIMNKFLNNKKLSIISPVIFKGKLMSYFEKKAELFNNHFASQRSLVKNASALPNLEHKTDKRLNYFFMNKNYILSIIKNLNASKAHGWREKLTRMIKPYCKTIVIPVKLIFRSMLKEGVFPNDWKKAMKFQSTKQTLKI